MVFSSILFLERYELGLSAAGGGLLIRGQLQLWEGESSVLG